MTMPKGYVARKGDVVLVRARVKYDSDDAVERVHLAILDCEHAHIAVAPEFLTGLCGREWAVDDRVTIDEGDEGLVPATVRAVAGENVWIEYDPGGFATVGTLDLRPAPVDPVDEPFVVQPPPLPEPEEPAQ